MFDEERDASVIELGIFVPAEPSIVWEALTEPEHVEKWLCRSTGLTAEVGASFIFEIPSEPPSEVACEVTAVDPERHFAHSYVDLRGTPPARWLVEWQLLPQGRGTRVLLSFSGFDIDDRRQKMARNAMERGWRALLPKLEQVARAM